MLVLTRREAQKIRIGDDITITVLRTRGSDVKFGIDAPRDMPIHRHDGTETEEMDLTPPDDRG